MFEFNKKFWDDFEPGYYDKNFKSDKVDNSIQQLWHYLTFKKQERFLTLQKFIWIMLAVQEHRLACFQTQ